MKKVRIWVLYSFYPIVMLNTFLDMFGYHFDRILIFPLLFALLAVVAPLIMSRKSNYTAKMVTLFLVYNILSVLMYAVNDRPFECYYKLYLPFIFPMLFFCFGNLKRFDSSAYYKLYIILCFITFAYGFYLYTWMPGFYLSYLTDIYNESWYTETTMREESVLLFSRFSSYFGSSYAISYLSVPCLCLSIKQLYSSNSKSWLAFYYVAIVVSWIAAILCQQRVAMLASSAILIFALFYSRKANKSAFFVLLIMFSVIIAIAVSYLVGSGRLDLIEEMLTGRLESMNMNDAYVDNGRSQQYISTIKDMKYYLTGGGLGSASSTASRHGFKAVLDGEYVRIFAENGIIGSVIFLTIVVSTLRRVLSKRKIYLWEGMVVLYYLSAALVSNSLSINLIYAPMFWFCIGRIWSKYEITYITNGNNRILSSPVPSN